ncbi:MAG: polyprenyl synthetase family protein [Candidatus Shapirobacteria bacterium]
MQHQDFVNLLKKNRELVWPIIEKKIKLVNKFDDFCCPAAKYQNLMDFNQEMVDVYPKRMGKYFRPCLVILAGEAMGVPVDILINTAAAQQISEEWILIHDDVEDDSLERRGEITLHRKYSKELAINTGDALHLLMWEILQDNRLILGAEKTFLIMEEFTKIIKRTILGQTIEIKWAQENKKKLSDDDILLILESKTGYYTVAGPMREGAIIAGATSEQLEKIYEFGKLTGYCFQIKDDLLDLTSDFCGQKKQCGNDIYEGKRTIMLAHLMRTINGSDKDKLEKIMEKCRENKNETEVKWVIQKMEECKSLDYAQNLMNKFAAEAKEYFKNELGFLKENPARSYLEYLPDFLVNRDH